MWIWFLYYLCCVVLVPLQQWFICSPRTFVMSDPSRPFPYLRSVNERKHPYWSLSWSSLGERYFFKITSIITSFSSNLMMEKRIWEPYHLNWTKKEMKVKPCCCKIRTGLDAFFFCWTLNALVYSFAKNKRLWVLLKVHTLQPSSYSVRRRWEGTVLSSPVASDQGGWENKTRVEFVKVYIFCHVTKVAVSLAYIRTIISDHLVVSRVSSLKKKVV